MTFAPKKGGLGRGGKKPTRARDDFLGGERENQCEHSKAWRGRYLMKEGRRFVKTESRKSNKAAGETFLKISRGRKGDLVTNYGGTCSREGKKRTGGPAVFLRRLGGRVSSRKNRRERLRPDSSQQDRKRNERPEGKKMEGSVWHWYMCQDVGTVERGRGRKEKSLLRSVLT